MADESQPNAAQNAGATAEEQKNEQPVADAAPQAEPESFGYPHSLLLANDIDPEILLELPEDIREAVLMPLQEQLAQHQAAERARQ